MGTPKALLKRDGKAFVEIVRDALFSAGIRHVAVVLGRRAEEIRNGWRPAGENILVNPEPERGQVSSVRTALESAPEQALAALLALVDQPTIRPATYKMLADRYLAEPCGVLIPKYHGKRGHPILLNRSVWPLCFEVPDEKGLHWVTHHPSVRVLDVPVEDENILADIDTPQDLARLA